MKDKYRRRCLFTVLGLVFLITSEGFASWLIYDKPEFKGRVIDAETKQPIESAVVVVVYYKHSLIGGPGGGYSSVVKVKETLTDEKGEFSFPAYTTLIQPNSIEDYARFIIYKAGYGNFPNQKIYPPRGMSLDDIETFFSKEIGSQGEVEILVVKGGKSEWKFVKMTFGVVELPKLKTRKERLGAITSPLGHVRSKDIPLLDEAINEEYGRFGLKPGTVGEK